MKHKLFKPINVIVLMLFIALPGLSIVQPNHTVKAQGGTNLALGKAVYASSVHGANAASRVTDSSTATAWSSTFVEPAWIYIDLDSPKAIEQVILIWEGVYFVRVKQAVGSAFCCDSGYEINIDAVPVVSSIKRADSNPTSASTVKFTISFSESVTGVDASDFYVQTTSDLSEARVVSVSGVETLYTVTVSTGAYNDSSAGKIDINRATLSELESLPAIGPTVAQRIIDYRTLNGPFLKTEDIMNVSGIGPSTYERIKDLITVGGHFLRLDVVDDDSIKDVIGNPLGGVGKSNGDYTSGEIYTVKKRMTLRSAGAYDGWVLESTETSNMGGTMNATTATFNVGDAAGDKQYRGILSFNTAALPDKAVITSVTFKLRKQGVVGTNPFSTHGKLIIDMIKGVFSGNRVLQRTDFQAAASKNGVVAIPNAPSAGWYSKVLPRGAFTYINKVGITQIRLRFSLDDNDDLAADYLRFYSGNAIAANRPQLIIEYYVP